MTNPENNEAEFLLMYLFLFIYVFLNAKKHIDHRSIRTVFRCYMVCFSFGFFTWRHRKDLKCKISQNFITFCFVSFVGTVVVIVLFFTLSLVYTKVFGF